MQSRFSFLIVLIFCSCSFKHKEDDKKIVIENNPGVVVNIDDLPEESTIYYSMLYKDVTYTPLEANIHSTLGRIHKLEITKDGKMIAFDRDNSNIVVFDRQGKYINNIGEKGKAKNEYIHPIDISYDFYNKNVLVLDNPGYLIRYKLNGEFVSKIKIPFHVGHISALNKNHVIIHNNYTDKIGKDDFGYNYYILDNQGNIVNRFDPYEPEFKFIHVPSNEVFFKYNGHVFTKTFYSSHVYEIQIDSIKEAMRISIEGHMDDMCFIGKNKDNEEQRFENYCFPYCSEFFQNSKYIVLYISKKHRGYICLFNKRNKEVLIGNGIINNLNGFVSNLSPLNVVEGKAYLSIDPSDFESVNEYINSDAYKQHNLKISNDSIEWIKNMVNHKNPIIQICTLME